MELYLLHSSICIFLCIFIACKLVRKCGYHFISFYCQQTVRSLLGQFCAWMAALVTLFYLEKMLPLENVVDYKEEMVEVSDFKIQLPALTVPTFEAS